MKLRFGYANTKMIEKYSGKDDPCDHLTQWTKAREQNHNQNGCTFFVIH